MILGVPFFVVLGEIIRRLVNMRLEKQGMSVSLADYHVSGTAPEDFDEEHKENLFVRTINKIGRFFAQLFRKIKQLFKRK